MPQGVLCEDGPNDDNNTDDERITHSKDESK